MNTHLHNSDEIFSSAQYGWEQMKFLLDKKLPVTNKKNSRKLYVPFFATASLLTILLFSSLIVQDGSHQNSSNLSSKSRATQIEITKNSEVNHTKIHVANRNHIEKINTKPGYIVPINSTEKEIPADYDLQLNATFLTVTKKAIKPTIEDDVKQTIEILNATNKSLKIITSLATKDSANTDSTNRTTAARLKNNNSKWNLSAGLGINGMIGQRQNLQPYPVAEVRYNITPCFFMSLGLSAGSPVSTNSHGISKTVYLNDTANNVQLYNKITSYSRLYYADFPLLAGINMGKRFSVQTGLQASILLNTIEKASIEKYDFQMRLANGPQNNLVSGMAAVSESVYKINVRKIDYRFTTGLTYSINKTSFNLLYQYSLHPVLEGNNVSSNKNQLVTLSMLYKIK